MTLAIIGLVVIAAVVAIIAAVALRSRGPSDAVDSFRRQIDALSPEARKPVVDQVQSVTPRPITPRRTSEPTPDATDADETVTDAEGGDVSGAADTDADAATDPPTDEDGARGS